MNAPPLVKAVKVGKRFGDHQALSDITMDVMSGEVVCLIGPSGSGKTTFLRCINMLEMFDSGGLWLDGELLGYRRSGDHLRALSSNELARQRSKTGMVFQRFNLFPHMTALENITAGPLYVQGRLPSEAKDMAMLLLRRVGLEHKAGAYPGELSGGQQQRVAIARALAMQPKLMLFDEPTSALDPELVGEVLNVMRDLAGTGMTMIVVTHELGFAREVGDRIVFMDQGRVVESGTSDEVMRAPQEQRTRDFLRTMISRS